MVTCIFYFFALLQLTYVIGKSVMFFDFVGNCKDQNSDSPIRLENSSWGMASSEVSEYNTTFVVIKTLGPIQATVVLKKCAAGGHETDCEPIFTVPVADLCTKLTEKNQFWSSFMENTQPLVTCPFKKGTYRATHVAVKSNLVERFVTQNAIYAIYYQLSFRNQDVGCIKMVVKLVSIKSKKRKSLIKQEDHAR